MERERPGLVFHLPLLICIGINFACSWWLWALGTPSWMMWIVLFVVPGGCALWAYERSSDAKDRYRAFMTQFLIAYFPATILVMLALFRAHYRWH